MTVPHAAGALYSTTEDLLRWERGLFGGKLLKPESLAKMTTAVKDHYAFGVGVDEKDGRRRISHGGGIEGFNTQLITSRREVHSRGAGKPEWRRCGSDCGDAGQSGGR